VDHPPRDNGDSGTSVMVARVTEPCGSAVVERFARASVPGKRRERGSWIVMFSRVVAAQVYTALRIGSRAAAPSRADRHDGWRVGEGAAD
jgi:hypothetical protein